MWRLCRSVVKPRGGLVQIPAHLLTGLGGSCCVYPQSISLFLTKPQFYMTIMEAGAGGDLSPDPGLIPGNRNQPWRAPSPYQQQKSEWVCDPVLAHGVTWTLLGKKYFYSKASALRKSLWAPSCHQPEMHIPSKEPPSILDRVHELPNAPALGLAGLLDFPFHVLTNFLFLETR